MNLRRSAAAAAIAVTTTLAVLVPAGASSAHGTMSDPVNRVYQCYLEGPEHPVSTACKAAVAEGGTYALYNWMAIRQPNAGGNSPAVVPDGQLCSGGDPEHYGAFDEPRTDWVATPITAGPRTVTYHATAAHINGSWNFYITKQGWDPTRPLRWGDLTQFAEFDRSPYFSWTVNIPQRTGRHIIYVVWQRSPNDAAEAFYSCSDVVFTTPANASQAVPYGRVPVNS